MQEDHIENACIIFRKSESPIELAYLIQESQRKRTLSGNSGNNGNNDLQGSIYYK